MLKEERQLAILTEVERHNRIQLTDIAEKMDVSIDTVRRDVKELDADNRLKKVHGGAISLGFTSQRAMNNHIYAQEEKMAIGAKAVKLLREGMVFFLDGGTTCLEMARAIPDSMHLTCFTISLQVALELHFKPKVKVIFLGGEISKEAQVSYGTATLHQLSDIRVDYGFIGTGYVDATHGLTEFDWDIVQLKKGVIKAAKKTVLLCISEKLNSQHRFKTCDISAIDTMITELDPTSNQLTLFRGRDIRIL